MSGGSLKAPTPIRRLTLSPEEIERRCARVDLHYWVYRRVRARDFDEWLDATWGIDAAFKVMGQARSVLGHLVDQEMIFPKVRRVFENGQGLED